ncbi:MAG: class I SAM-dependent methyltransferase [Gemmataceae bacterium]|nr:class I SAM-dependent methyltransferase [Gemmataceae bacterium]MCI0739706.1 class I SAM-dependent methyltransferase [Gemmataceae bacterium]
MRYLDRLLQRWRAGVARPWIPAGARVLDIGCHQGEFLEAAGNQIGPSVGLDPRAVPRFNGHYRIEAERFAIRLPFDNASFDAVVLLATLEHIKDKQELASECYRILRPAGRVVLTVPSPAVDQIVTALCWLRLADGMCLDEHHGFDASQTRTLFENVGFKLAHTARFQLRLNNLFVFCK